MVFVEFGKADEIKAYDSVLKRFFTPPDLDAISELDTVVYNKEFTPGKYSYVHHMMYRGCTPKSGYLESMAETFIEPTDEEKVMHEFLDRVRTWREQGIRCTILDSRGHFRFIVEAPKVSPKGVVTSVTPRTAAVLRALRDLEAPGSLFGEDFVPVKKYRTGTRFNTRSQVFDDMLYFDLIKTLGKTTETFYPIGGDKNVLLVSTETLGLDSTFWKVSK